MSATFEKIVVPQKIYYRCGAVRTVASEVSAQNIALICDEKDVTIASLVRGEFEKIRGLNHIYPYVIKDTDHELSQKMIAESLKLVDTVVAVGSCHLFNEVAIQLNKNMKQLIIVPTDAKPLALMAGSFVENGQVQHNEKLVPEMVILDSGVTVNISKEDCALLQKVCSVEEKTCWVQFTKTAQEISKELLAGFGKIDHPVWCERCTNLVGICMLGKPCGKRVLQVLGLAK